MSDYEDLKQEDRISVSDYFTVINSNNSNTFINLLYNLTLSI